MEELFCILIVVITQLHIITKFHQTVHLKWVEFNVHKLYLKTKEKTLIL